MSQHAAVRLDEGQNDNLDIAVLERKDDPGCWGVEAIDVSANGDGECYLAIFSGPDARARAFEYAEMKYGFR